jgi:hypothetical protein
VQALLGHKFVDTTLGYARLYDGTIAADYYRAMAQVEKQLDLQRGAEKRPARRRRASCSATWPGGRWNTGVTWFCASATCLREPKPTRFPGP